MLFITYMDWFGSDEELKKMKAAWEKACEETEGVKSTTLMVPHSEKFHFAWFTKADSYAKVLEANAKVMEKYPRDRKIMTHSVASVFTKY